MSRIRCDVLLDRGKWSPRKRGSLSHDVTHALYRMGHAHGAYTRSIDFETSDSGVAVYIIADWWRGDDAELFGDLVAEALLYHLAPEFDSQLEIDHVEEVPGPLDYGRALRRLLTC